MRVVVLITGILLTLVGGIQTARYVLDFRILSDYGKGFVWGSIILLSVGLTLLVIWFRLFKAKKSKLKSE
jgi:hypothetical protein